jgi:hypothetical protein
MGTQITCSMPRSMPFLLGDTNGRSLQYSPSPRLTCSQPLPGNLALVRDGGLGTRSTAGMNPTRELSATTTECIKRREMEAQRQEGTLIDEVGIRSTWYESEKKIKISPTSVSRKDKSRDLGQRQVQPIETKVSDEERAISSLSFPSPSPASCTPSTAKISDLQVVSLTLIPCHPTLSLACGAKPLTPTSRKACSLSLLYAEPHPYTQGLALLAPHGLLLSPCVYLTRQLDDHGPY